MRVSLSIYLKIYFKNRPLFLGLIRAKELELYERFLEKELSEGLIKRSTFNKSENRGSLRVLDFGCGDGFFTTVAFGHLYEFSQIEKRISMNNIIGLEVDGGMAERARRCRVYDEVIVYDGGQFPFPDEHFDGIFSNCVLEHVADLAGNLAEIYRVLKPKGRFYTTVMTNKWEEYLFGSLLLGKVYEKWMRKTQKHFNLLSAKEWQRAFDKAGLNVVETVGYLDKRASRWIDVLHYVSIGSLLSYKLTGRWVLFPRQYDLLPLDKWVLKLIEKDVPVNKAAANFYVLQKSLARTVHGRLESC